MKVLQSNERDLKNRDSSRASIGTKEVSRWGLRLKRRSGRLFEVAGDHGCAHHPKVTRDQAQQAGVPREPRTVALAHEGSRLGRGRARASGDARGGVQEATQTTARSCLRRLPQGRAPDTVQRSMGVLPGVTAVFTAVGPSGARRNGDATRLTAWGCPNPERGRLMPYLREGRLTRVQGSHPAPRQPPFSTGGGPSSQCQEAPAK